MTDHPRFQMAESAGDRCYRQYHGAPQVEFVFRLVDWWLGHRRRRFSDQRRPILSTAGKQALAERHSLSTLQLG
jgi:hypothetical protein